MKRRILFFLLSAATAMAVAAAKVGYNQGVIFL